MSPRFLLDGMLGALARWLRICGYNSKYRCDATDEELISITIEEDRSLLTRDRTLIRKATKAGADAFFVEGENNAEKLASVSKRFNLKLNLESSLCPRCGSNLKTVSKNDIKSKLPPRTFRAYDNFWICSSCNEIFWRGSHWKNIVKTIDEATSLASSNSEEKLLDINNTL